MSGLSLAVVLAVSTLPALVVLGVALFLVRRSLPAPPPRNAARDGVAVAPPDRAAAPEPHRAHPHGDDSGTVASAPSTPTSAMAGDGETGVSGVEASQRAGAEVVRQAEEEAAAIRRRAEAAAREIAEAAESAARAVREHADAERAEVEEQVRAARASLRATQRELERREARVTEREERLDAQAAVLDERAAALAVQQEELAVSRAALADAEEERRLLLERAAGLTAEEAKAELVSAVEHQAKRDAALMVRHLESEAKLQGEARARHIVASAVQRVASDQTAETSVSVLHLPGDDMKGRIIGREGRNIRTFEAVTGVNVIIDDTPEAVVLSCFDPVRREVARHALEALVADGRIHPHRIEEQVERSRAEIDALCQRAAEDACVEVGVADLHPELVTLLGRLRFRTSYGQVVLKHLVESAHVAGLMAAELGLDVALLKRCAFLHDIGKALTHEVEGSHALVGAEVARRYGEHDDVVHAIEAHHGEVEPRTVEAVLTQAADACSGGRPGARRESIEAYVTRLQRLEEIARTHEGVDKVYAMQAGHEVRVLVQPDVVDDIAAQVLARDIAKEVEEELTYPGQIRVTVVRESRATEVAR